MEDSYQCDHYDYKGQPWHLSTSITFTITDKGAEITLAKFDRYSGNPLNIESP